MLSSYFPLSIDEAGKINGRHCSLSQASRMLPLIATPTNVAIKIEHCCIGRRSGHFASDASNSPRLVKDGCI